MIAPPLIEINAFVPVPGPKCACQPNTKAFAMSIVYFAGAALFFALAQSFIHICDILKESGQ